VDGTGRTGAFAGLGSGESVSLLAANGVLHGGVYGDVVGGGGFRKEAMFGLIHLPEAEFWTFGNSPVAGQHVLRIERIGVNFGAQGDRLAEDGTFWVNSPSADECSSDPVVVIVKPAVRAGKDSSASVFRGHASTIRSRGCKWIGASGVEGVESVWLPLGLNPGVGVPEDTFSVVWTGFVSARYDEDYRFRAVADDGVRLWIAGTLVIDSWSGEGRSEAIGEMRLKAGEKYPFKMHYREHESKAGVELMWSSESTPEEVIPGKCMFTETGWHGGLTGTYYGNEDFTGAFVRRIDYGISFDWGDGAPEILDGIRLEYPQEAGEWVYKVDLYFAEPYDVGSGERVFDVKLEGKTVLKDFDIVKAAGGAGRAIVKEFDAVRTGPVLDISLVPVRGKPLLCGVRLTACSED
jgi:hypothetical protein